MKKADEVSAQRCAEILDEIVDMIPPNQQTRADILAGTVSMKLAEMAALLVSMAEFLERAPKLSSHVRLWVERAREVVGRAKE